MSARTSRFISAVVGTALLLTSGCVCSDGVTTARSVALRIQPPGADVRLKTEWSGQHRQVTRDESGVYRFDIPSMRWADNVWLGFIKVRTRSDDAEAFLYVSRPDGSVTHVSERQIARLPVDADGISILKIRK